MFGGLLTGGGIAYLGVSVGIGCAAVIAVIAVLYLGLYTPLKRVSPLATVLGAVPGALPPVAGWVAARGELGIGAAVLFAILFLWQLPHTLAIARLYRDDYARAGIRVLPVVDPDGGSTERQIVAGCLALHAAGLLPTLVGLTGGVYFFGALLLGALFLVVGMAQALRPSAPAARRVVLASVIYLPVLLALMALDKVGVAPWPSRVLSGWPSARGRSARRRNRRTAIGLVAWIVGLMLAVGPRGLVPELRRADAGARPRGSAPRERARGMRAPERGAGPRPRRRATTGNGDGPPRPGFERLADLECPSRHADAARRRDHVLRRSGDRVPPAAASERPCGRLRGSRGCRSA